jgi:hypothetical protein
MIAIKMADRDSMQQLPLLDIKIVFVPVTNYSETLLRLPGGGGE